MFQRRFFFVAKNIILLCRLVPSYFLANQEAFKISRQFPADTSGSGDSDKAWQSIFTCCCESGQSRKFCRRIQSQNSFGCIQENIISLIGIMTWVGNVRKYTYCISLPSDNVNWFTCQKTTELSTWFLFWMVSLTGSHSVGKIPDRISTNGLQALTCAYSSWVVRHVTMCASWFFFSTMYNPIKLWSEMIFINFRLCIRNLPKLQHVSITIFYQCGRR